MSKPSIHWWLNITKFLPIKKEGKDAAKWVETEKQKKQCLVSA